MLRFASTPLTYSQVQVRPRRCAFTARHGSKILRCSPKAAANFDISGFDLSLPDIDGDAQSYQLNLGAQLNDAGVVTTFGQRDKVLTAIVEGVALIDRSHWGRLRVGGPQAVAYLQRVAATRSLEGLKPGQGADLEFIADGVSQGTCLALVQGQGALLVAPPELSALISDKLDTSVTAQDQVQVRDISRQCAMFSLVGPNSVDILRKMGAGSIVEQAYGSHTVLKMKEKPVLVVVGSGLNRPGFTIIPDESIAGDLYAALVEQECALMGQDEWAYVVSLQQEIAVDTRDTTDTANTSSASSDSSSDSEESSARSESADTTTTTTDSMAAAAPELSESNAEDSKQATSSTDSESGSGGSADTEAVASSEEEDMKVNKWKLIVDRAMLPTRKARVVDIAEIQRHGNPGLRL